MDTDFDAMNDFEMDRHAGLDVWGGLIQFDGVGSITVIVMECNEPVSIQEALEHLRRMAVGSTSKVKRVTVEMAE